jgi:hypothetical protein
MTKAELLSKLDEKALRNIAKNENFTVPKTYDKQDLVKYLEGTLTLQKIKEYTCEIYEKETKRTIIHETIKEKGIRIKAKESLEVKFDKLEVIRELTQKEKIDSLVLKEIARNLKQPLPKGRGFDLYDKMNEEMLQFINNVFVKKESDGHGLFLEYRTANFLVQNAKTKIVRIEIRHKCSNSDEIDVTGFNSQGKPVIIAECKDKHAKKEDIAKWIKNSKQIFQDNNGSLEESYFVTSDKFTDQNYGYIEEFRDIDSKKGILKIHGFLRGLIRNLGDEKTLTESRGLSMSIYEVRQNQFVKVFPRK